MNGSEAPTYYWYNQQQQAYTPSDVQSVPQEVSTDAPPEPIHQSLATFTDRSRLAADDGIITDCNLGQKSKAGLVGVLVIGVFVSFLTLLRGLEELGGLHIIGPRANFVAIVPPLLNFSRDDLGNLSALYLALTAIGHGTVFFVFVTAIIHDNITMSVVFAVGYTTAMIVEMFVARPIAIVIVGQIAVVLVSYLHLCVVANTSDINKQFGPINAGQPRFDQTKTFSGAPHDNQLRAHYPVPSILNSNKANSLEVERGDLSRKRPSGQSEASFRVIHVSPNSSQQSSANNGETVATVHGREIESKRSLTPLDNPASILRSTATSLTPTAARQQYTANLQSIPYQSHLNQSYLNQGHLNQSNYSLSLELYPKQPSPTPGYSGGLRPEYSSTQSVHSKGLRAHFQQAVATIEPQRSVPSNVGQPQSRHAPPYTNPAVVVFSDNVTDSPINGVSMYRSRREETSQDMARDRPHETRLQRPGHEMRPDRRRLSHRDHSDSDDDYNFYGGPLISDEEDEKWDPKTLFDARHEPVRMPYEMAFNTSDAESVERYKSVIGCIWSSSTTGKEITPDQFFSKNVEKRESSLEAEFNRNYEARAKGGAVNRLANVTWNNFRL